MTRTLSFLLLSTALIACSAEPSTEIQAQIEAESAPDTDVETQPIRLTELWVLDGFDAPESVIKVGDGSGYYVSNVGGDGSTRDNDGAISRLTSDGQMLDRNWVTGTQAMPLHAPKGMAIATDGSLLVTDIDHLVIIDPDSQMITARIPAEGAAFLNDVARGPGDVALISDSGNARIYAYEAGAITIWLEDDRLAGINGLQMQNGRLLVTTMRDGDLLSIDPTTKALTGLATGMVNADGIGLRSDGSYIISSWPGQLWHARDGQAPILLQDTSGETGAVLMNDILLADDGLLVTPNWMPGTVRGYSVK